MILSEIGITHRDIKPENILIKTIENKKVYKICGICYNLYF
jgi:serine/threonine protein kinase